MESFAAESWWGNVSACAESQNPPSYPLQPASAGVSLSQQAFPLGWLRIGSHPAEMSLRSPESDQGAVLICLPSLAPSRLAGSIYIYYRSMGFSSLLFPTFLEGLWLLTSGDCFLFQQVWLSSVPVAQLGATLHILLFQGIMPVRSAGQSLCLCPGRHNFLRGPQKKACCFSLFHSQGLRSVVQKAV